VVCVKGDRAVCHSCGLCWNWSSSRVQGIDSPNFIHRYGIVVDCATGTLASVRSGVRPSICGN